MFPAYNLSVPPAIRRSRSVFNSSPVLDPSPTLRLKVLAAPCREPRAKVLMLVSLFPAPSSRLRVAPSPTVTLVMSPGLVMPPERVSRLPLPLTLRRVLPLSVAATVRVPALTRVSPV